MQGKIQRGKKKKDREPQYWSQEWAHAQCCLAALLSDTYLSEEWSVPARVLYHGHQNSWNMGMHCSVHSICPNIETNEENQAHMFHLNETLLVCILCFRSFNFCFTLQV